MRIIHCADIHLDSNLQTNLSQAQAKTRNLEILDTFERMIEYGVNHDVSVIIIAGDLFDTTHISPTTQTRVLHAIRQHPQIDFIYLSGNHDETSFITSLTELPNNLKIFNDTWQTFHYGKVQITGRVLTHGTVNDIGRNLHLDRDAFNVVVLHGDINHEINLSHLCHHNIDYLALGHLHSYSRGQLDARGTYCYAGCLEGRGFDECGAKGFILLEIDDTQLRYTAQFVPFAKRQLCEVQCDITEAPDWFAVESQVMLQVQNIARENLLKITLTGQYPLTMDKQVAMLAQKLQDFYVVKINDISRLMTAPQDFAKDRTLRGAFVRLVQAAHLPESQQERVIQYGLKALQGETLR
ncbi:MAG: metallophosphoesterase [Prevotella sp.]|nr:metallophosphoesterase [Prevotella sp.]